MTDFFDDCPVPEPSSLLGFSSNKIISDAEGRSDNCLSAAMDNSRSKYIAVCEGNALVKSSGDETIAFHPQQDIARYEPDFTNAILPGTIDDLPIIAVPVDFDAENLPADYQAIDTRSIMYSSTIPHEQAGAVGMATSLLHWHKTNQFCGVCGAPSRSHIGGMRRDCSKCGSKIFPRTDPAVIMLAIHSNKCLLGRSPNFPPNWYSCLAGFVEPGETIEQAVRRETREESGISIGRVKYYASQPWPFPHSLMIGAYCEATSEEITFDGEELEDCRWFEREEVLAMIEKRHENELRAPPSLSIAAHILRNWLEKTAQSIV